MPEVFWSGSQVEVGPAGHAPQLAPAEGEDELEVGGGVGVVGQLLGIVVTQTQVLVLHAQAQQPLVAEVLPVGEPLQLGAGGAEELQLHLLELTGAEGEVARGDLVAESLAHLAHAEGQLAAGGALDVLEVDEDTLGSLGTQIHGVLGVLGDTLEGLEHQVKLTDVCKVMFAAAWAGNLMLFDKFHHLFLRPGIYASFNLDPMLCTVVLDQLICTETLMALLTVHQRIRKSAQVTRSYPCLRIHKNRTVYAYIVGRLLNKFLPPRSFYVVFQPPSPKFPYVQVFARPP